MSRRLPLHDELVDLVYPGVPALHPDGRRLAYVAPGDGGHPVVRTIEADAPATTATWDLGAPVVLVRWARTGDRLWAVVAAAHGEATGLLLLDGAGRVLARTDLAGSIEDVVPLDGSAALLRVADVGADRDGMNLGLRVRAPEPGDPRVRRSQLPPLRRLVRVDLGDAGLEPTPLDLGDWSVWDVDAAGDQAVVVASADPAPAGYYRPTLLALTALGSDRPRIRELPPFPGQLARPRISPDGRRVAVLEGQSIVAGIVHLVDLGTGVRRTVARLDDVTDLGWVDAATLWFAGWADLGVQLGRVALADDRDPHDPRATPDRVTRWTCLATAHGESGQPELAVAPDGERAYAVWEQPGEPPEVVRLSLAGPGTTALTTHNATLRAVPTGVVTEPVEWPAPDGATVHGLLLRPADAAGPLPLVLLLHGGPTWLWSAAYAPAESNHLALPLAAAGAAVLLPNPRGSSGRGQPYAARVAGDLGGRDLADVLAGVDHLVERGVADPDRSAVMGLSYGGFLTARAAVSERRFRAAVVMSGVGDWLGFATTSAIGGGYDAVYLPAGDLASPTGHEVLVAASPLYQVHAGATPTLILHGELDRITPLAQAEQLFGRLARAGVESELVVYPREGHELVEPDHRRDAAARVARWLRSHGVLNGTED
ncbi:hypothetical protein GCM10027062_10880 [Nocardioides hungaricus]